MQIYPDLADILIVSSGQADIGRGLEDCRNTDESHCIIVYNLKTQTEELLNSNRADFLIDQEGDALWSYSCKGKSDRM